MNSQPTREAGGKTLFSSETCSPKTGTHGLFLPTRVGRNNHEDAPRHLSLQAAGSHSVFTGDEPIDVHFSSLFFFFPFLIRGCREQTPVATRVTLVTADCPTPLRHCVGLASAAHTGPGVLVADTAAGYTPAATSPVLPLRSVHALSQQSAAAQSPKQSLAQFENG